MSKIIFALAFVARIIRRYVGRSAATKSAIAQLNRAKG